ncbi:VacB/RNase II family 3'-5' exoribonuclease [Reinekea blandensis]|nr:VacB/RNase II family 3'-5' exoribonuclease [Reinekea blandensis]
MLDDKSLAVLQSLKSDIKAAKTLYEGTVKGTGKKFGFVVNAADGSEHFLPPDEMSRVFPGDEVRFTIVDQDDGKTKAELEELIRSPLDEFNGVFFVRGKAQGVEPFDSAFGGWLFVPPKQTSHANNKDLVRAKVVRHPWDTGKAQAEVLKSLGSADNNRSWYSVALAEQGIPEAFSDAELKQAKALAEAGPETDPSRQDLTDLPFVTIDAASTKDMDDALFARPTENGWQLSVAIADASAYIPLDSELDKAAQKRLTTTYLPGLTLPMLPEILADSAMSLVPDETRPAMIFQMQIDRDGNVSDFEIFPATVRSQAKLAYDDVAHWFENNAIPESHQENLQALNDATQALASWRRKNANPMKDRVDYRIRVDDHFQVTDIVQEHKNPARALVEEAMIVTNYQSAQWLQDQPGLFMCHLGFKPDRETELKGLLRDYTPDVAELNGHDLADFRKIMAASQTIDFPLYAVLQKRFDRGFWSREAQPHFGLGLSRYTNVTSPIRKYSDLCMHRLIKAKLASRALPDIDHALSLLNERGNVSRFAAQKIENRLRYQWLSQQPEQTYRGTIVHLNANNLMVRLDDCGAVGQVDLRKRKDEFSYDPLRMMLKFEEFQYQLEQEVTVKIASVSAEQLKLEIVEDDG